MPSDGVVVSFLSSLRVSLVVAGSIGTGEIRTSEGGAGAMSRTFSKLDASRCIEGRAKAGTPSIGISCARRGSMAGWSILSAADRLPLFFGFSWVGTATGPGTGAIGAYPVV